MNAIAGGTGGSFPPRFAFVKTEVRTRLHFGGTYDDQTSDDLRRRPSLRSAKPPSINLAVQINDQDTGGSFQPAIDSALMHG